MKAITIQKQENRGFFHRLNHTINDRGQSTIEFLSAFAFSFSLLFLFVKIAMNYTNGYMVHYANYMASRSYLISDNNTGASSVYANAESAAKKVFNQYYLNLFLPNVNFTFAANSPDATEITNKYYIGTHVKYDEILSLVKMVGGKEEMLLTSESFLGKEPPRSECIARVCSALKFVAGSVNCKLYTTLIDNGC